MSEPSAHGGWRPSSPIPGTTWWSILTPSGRGAIAVIRVGGPRAVDLVDSVFRPASSNRLRQARPGELRFGRVGAGDGDEVVVVVIEGPEGREVEIQGHGGSLAVTLVGDALESAGAVARRAEFTRGQDSRHSIEADARIDLEHASTFKVAEILLEQANGALRGALERVVAMCASAPTDAVADLERLLSTRHVGLRLLRGWSVVLAGRPNVGKSRLLNALAGFERAIVSPVAGTTRDIVQLDVALDGWPIELSDTAGLREATEEVEFAGVERARERQAQADLVLLVLDRSESLSELDRQLIAAHPQALFVANKSDLPAAWTPFTADLVTVSAESGEGVASLTDALVHRLIPNPPGPGAAVVFREQQALILSSALDQLRSGDAAGAARRIRDALFSERLWPHP